MLLTTFLLGALALLPAARATPAPSDYQTPAGANPWTYVENFDTFATGQPLHGQGGWTGWNVSGETNYKIQTYLGSKVAEVAITTHSTITRDLPAPLTRGAFKVVMGKSTSADGRTDVGIMLKDSNGSGRVYARLGGDGHISIYDHTIGTYRPILRDYTAGTLYEVNIEFDQVLQPNKYRARAKAKGASAEGPWSPWTLVNNGVYERLTTLVFDTDWNGGALDVKGYFDFVGPADVSLEPSPGSPEGLRYPLTQIARTDFPTLPKVNASVTREIGTNSRSHVRICPGVGIAARSSNRFPNDNRYPAESR